MKSIGDFHVFYREELKSSLQEFEKWRKKIVQKLSLTGASIFGGSAIFFAYLQTSGFHPAFLLIPVGLGAAGLGISWWLMTRKFISAFKTEVIRKVIAFIDTSLFYSPDGYIPRSTFLASGIFQNRIDRYRGEDRVKGSLGKTAIDFSELHAEYKTRTTDSKGRSRTQWHTIFKGLYFIADFNKHFKGRTVVLPDTAERLFGFLGKTMQSWNFSRDELISLEDPEFEKLFVVYGTDQIESRYILSPSLMKRITDFRNGTGLNIYLSFVESNVHLAITTKKNMFEPRILKTVLDFELMKEYFDDVKFATGIVDDLNLNTRIWTKE